MDTGILQSQGSIGLRPGEFLRLADAAGRHISVLQGIVWVTQNGDRRDLILRGGESLRFEHNGFTLVQAIDGEAKLMLEEGLVPQGGKAPEAEDIAYFERRGRRMRAEAMGQALAGLGGLLKALWAGIARLPAATLRTGKTVKELRALSDHTLKDIGVRRDQIDCVARATPC
jgi:uncharacterized protein YjiS (DUF1127 family)